jgi:hypothetical protein
MATSAFDDACTGLTHYCSVYLVVNSFACQIPTIQDPTACFVRYAIAARTVMESSYVYAAREVGFPTYA